MANKTLRRGVAVALSTAMVAVTASCSLFGGDSAGTKPVLEKTNLRVGILPLVDVAPLYMAKEDGKFAAAGLNIDAIPQDNEKQAMESLRNGTIDIAFASHVTFFKAASEGTDLQLQGEAYQAGTNTMALVTLKNSNFVALNRGVSKPTIGVDALDSIGALTTKSVMNAAGAPNFNLKPMDFSKMESELVASKIDAAWMVEPHITRIQKTIGAVVLSDTARGGTLDFPMSGYAAIRKSAEESPKTYAAFRKVLADAQLLGTNHLKVQEVLVKYAELDNLTAALVAVGTYPVSINPVRLQRVADMMESTRMLNTRLDVLQLLPPSNPVN
ncbi:MULTISPECIES: ABC transporter substrate-binding protein [unclassified Crossiella]|uniref:ABC transporter substrate-binding protein n=1 Tax=unclassified Crossiella TaxID=2620835 RepID=UPI001FFE9BCE|nr:MULTISPECIES: ABC transporter substrate-binding protein [unclassified Crossiella]MCK2237931.1 ABC transporter substrate-binding protein [Crossiella sp. S99.2]MCK2255217.1 ABC transporter substrate-binding protein [Crossiella sp. S99.1]